MDSLYSYYGIDWIAMALCLAGVYLLGRQNRFGFLVFALGNALWVILAIGWMNSMGMVVGNAIFLVLNTHGFFSWSRPEKTQKEETISPHILEPPQPEFADVERSELRPPPPAA